MQYFAHHTLVHTLSMNLPATIIVVVIIMLLAIASRKDWL